MSEFDPSSFSIFKGRHSVQANACVGENGIADFETYAIGYFDATRLILQQVLVPENGLVQDTLVYPALYNFRHGIELSIKRYMQVLQECGIESREINLGTHSLGKLWNCLIDQAQADRRLIDACEPLTRVVEQVHDADPLAQEFRYSMLRNGNKSLKGKHVVDLASVLELLNFAQPKFDLIFGLVDRIAVERRFGSYTTRLNREELKQLSLELPDVESWDDSDTFDLAKRKCKKEYGLSDEEFEEALGFIREHREFSGNVGMPKAFTALSESVLDTLIESANKLRRYHLIDRDISDPNYFADPSWDYFAETGIILSPDFVGEITTILYHGRDRRYSEEYEDRLKQYSNFPDDADEAMLRGPFLHVFKKPSFIYYMCKGLRVLGYPNLAEKYYRLIEDDENRGPSVISF